MTEDEDFKIEGSEIEKNLMKHGSCSCGRSGMLYKSKCYFCYVEETRKVAEELATEIRAEGRSNLIDIEKMKRIRDKILELV
jgi:hypothetical protein